MIGSSRDAGPDLDGLRARIGRRLRFRYPGGTLTGVLLEVRPVVGPPLLALLSEADIFDEEGTCLQHARFLPLVVAPLAGIEEAPLGGA
jgi:hypothetical protein